jgi:hypothetical protein
MPPKQSGWQSQAKLATPDFSKASSVVRPVGPRPETMSEALAQLKKYIVQSIKDNNLLGISEGEMTSTADIIASCSDKAEIFNWASTLMLPETFAAEVVRRREDITRLGTRTDDDNVTTTSLATTATRAKKKGAGSRGKTVNLNSADKDATGGLVEGQQFECGCFATQHAFKTNCMNCGRIICMQESDDACYACGMDPAICLAYEVKVAEGRIDAAAEAKSRADYDKAIAQRDQLLRYAKERAKRTTVIDDQSGMYSNTGWVTEEERQAAKAAETEERKRVAALHRSSGAYTVHLDIVNQSVALGATALLQKAEEAVTKRAEGGGDAGEVQTLTDAEAMAKYGLAGTGDAAVHIPSVPEALLRAGRPPTPTSDEEDDDDRSGGDARVKTLPSLVQKIFYNDPTGKGEAASASAKPSTATAKAPRAAESSRVQTDYYEDDKITWRIARQQRRPGAAYGGDDESDGEGSHDDGPSRDEQEAKSRRRVPPPPPPTGTQLSQQADGEEEAPAAAGPSLAAAGPAATAASPYAETFKRLRHKDEGMCISMHQPWASLLVAGIKTHEGRSWGSDFRGRLWIHAAAAKPSHVEEIEAQYVPFLQDGQMFPTQYPTSCLLGYVVVVDNMDRAQYEAAFQPHERQESSEYKFICMGAKEVPFPLAMDGKHKIFKLEKKLWLAARKQIGEQPPK